MEQKKNRIITPSPLTRDNRVLVGIPQADVKNYCWKEFKTHLNRLNFKNHDIIIADNSPTRDNYKFLVKEGFNALHIKRKNKPIQLILAETHEAIRQHFLKGKWTHLLHLESDIMAIPDLIERLLIHDKPIVSGIYMINEGTQSHGMLQITETHGEIHETAILKDGADLNMIDGKIHEVFAHGLGCALIRRDVLEQIPFRWDGGDISPDTYWSFDTSAAGYPKYVDTSIILEHRNSSWTNELLTNSIFNK